MSWGRTASLALVLIASPLAASAQTTMAWPGESPTRSTPGWPGDGPPAAQPAPQASAAPTAAAPAPMAPAPAPMMAPPMGAMGGGMPGPGMGAGGQMPPCVAEFTRLRSETEKRGAAAKAASERKVSREEMCKMVSNLADAETKWFNYAKKNASQCGIPPEVIKQLAAGHTQMATARKNVCATGAVGGAPPPPSLSEALGTANLPAPTSPSTTRRGGAFDSLTGSVVR